MWELIRSFISFTWALALLSMKQFEGAVTSSKRDSEVSKAFPDKGHTIASSTRKSRTEDFRGELNISHFVVMGEGLAAGMGDFTLSAETQQSCFPAQMARQMQLNFPQRLLQPPGIGNLVGFASLPVLAPSPMQTTVVTELPPAPTSNLSIPGFRLRDSLELRPITPLIHRTDAKQTAVNLNWGLVPISRGQDSLPTQLEYALQLSAPLTMIELGYYEALDAAVNDDPGLLPKPDEFVSQCNHLLSQLRNKGSQVLVLNLPDPFDTAHFFSSHDAAKLLKVEPEFLMRHYEISSDSVVALSGVCEIGYQLFARELDALPSKAILSAGTPCTVSHWVSEINQRLMELAKANGCLVYDLAGMFRKIAVQGYQVGKKMLSREYLGGFYSLNGYYPGATGHAIIANEILVFLNGYYGSSFPMIDLNPIASADNVVAYRQPEGHMWSNKQLEPLVVLSKGQCHVSAGAETVHSARRNVLQRGDWTPLMPEEKSLPLRLPAGFEQVLPLKKATSYFGDGINPINCHDAEGIQWGTCGNSLFGGLAMVDSHLTGSIRIKFTPPVSDVSRFEISYEGGFTGENGDLATPQYFKMAFKQNRVDEVHGMLSTGTLNLKNGEVTDLKVYAQYSSTALFALVSVNPTFPKQPLVFPGQYGSAWANFEQREDGNLDFTFYGSTFVPLGKDIVWPLNFVGPSGHFATVPAAGTVMHPHLALSTKEIETIDAAVCPEIPFNSVQEFTLYSHNSAFGDLFTLNAAELGGPAKGRSHLLGRLQVQWGPQTGTTVPVAVWALPPGGIMAPLFSSPITQMFPARLSPGPQGFNENLRFPLCTYPLDALAIMDDPFDISIGAVDLRTGQFLNGLLHRAFICQDLIYALLRVEPRTPKDSFFFRGPAVLRYGAGQQKVLRFRGATHLPYPSGFAFPRPDFATALVVKEGSALDPYLWLHAIENCDPKGTLQGEEHHLRTSTGDDISYRYLISMNCSADLSFFEYENHTQRGRFHLHSVAWIDFCDSGTSSADTANCDTVSFSGFGAWSKDGIETVRQAAVQISTSAQKPYFAIQIGSGDISNVNTKPQDEQVAFP